MNTYNPEKKNDYRYASIKRDGYFTTLEYTENKIQVYSRNGRNLTESLTYLPWFQKFTDRCKRDKDDRQFFGELWLPGGVCTDVSHAWCVKNTSLRFDVFACDHLPTGCSMREVEDDARYMGLEVIPYWDFSDKQTTLNHWEHTDDVEGFVYSDGNGLNPVKEKPMQTIDLIITDWIPGTGQNANSVGSIVVATCDGEELATVGGLTKKFRYDMIQNPESYIGKVAEIKFQKVGTNGRLRHPSLVRLRDDKPACECTINQIM